jgi:uncharacterized protein HemY
MPVGPIWDQNSGSERVNNRIFENNKVTVVVVVVIVGVVIVVVKNNVRS